MLTNQMVATLTSRPDLIQVTYKVLSDKILDPEKKAKAIALEQTTGAWAPNDASGQKKLIRHRGEVLGIDERTHVHGRPYEYYLTIGFPPQNTEGDIPSLLTMILGKISMDGKIRLETLRLPDSFLKEKGPRFGVDGIREKIGEQEKPLTMAFFKPCMGLSPGELGVMFYELACGGMHLVADHEILPDLPTCPTEERLAACLKAGDRAKAETGQATLYAVNLTGPATKMITKARKLAKAGAQCFLLNVLSYGYGVLEELSQIGVPIMAHPALAGALCGSASTGMSYSAALGSLMRLGGADIVLFRSSYGTAALPADETRAIKERLLWTDGPLRKSLPAPSGGIHPGLVPQILQEYGNNVIINAGGTLHSHPKGARAGAKAFRQAIQWVQKRGNFGGISQREFPELTEALRLWGKK